MHVWVELAYSQFIAYTLLTPSSLMYSNAVLTAVTQ